VSDKAKVVHSPELLFMYKVYIIYSKTKAKFYTGHTKNITRRMDEHNMGNTISTRTSVPWDLIYTETFETKGEAIKKENNIKSRGAERYLKNKGVV